MITFEQAKELKYRQEIYTTKKSNFTNADGTPQTWRVNGRVKLWKTRPGDIQVPIKRGLHECYYLYQYGGYNGRGNLDLFTLTKEEK